MFTILPYLLQAPSESVRSMDAKSGVLLKQKASGHTIEILLSAFALSVLVDVPLALAIFLWQPLARADVSATRLVARRSAEGVAVAPLFLVWFGFGLVRSAGCRASALLSGGQRRP